MSKFFQSFINSIQRIDLTTPSWDVFVILFFLIGIFLYGIALGRNRLIVILIALYFSFTVFSLSELIRNTGMLLLRQNSFSPLVTFLVLFITVFLVAGQSQAVRSLSHEHGGALWQTIAFSILQMGLTMAIALSLLPVSLQARFSPFITQAFLSPLGAALWSLLPILFLTFGRIKGGNKSFTG